MLLFIGQDRENDFNWLKKTLLEKIPSIDFEIKPMVRPEGAMSATFLRQLAIDGKYDEFKKQMLETGLDNEIYIKHLFDEIKEKIDFKPSKKGHSKKGGKRKKKRKGNNKWTKKTKLTF